MSSIEIKSKPETLIPSPATILEVIDETPDVKTFRVKIDNEEKWMKFNPRPGQVAELSVFGIGESVFAVTASPAPHEYIEFSIKRCGVLTDAIHSMTAGDKVGVRGPYGNGFPVEDWHGKNIVVISGGIGMAPIRSVLNHILANRDNYGKLSIFYGARSPQDLVFKWQFEEWANAHDSDLRLTVDCGDATWSGSVGVVGAILKEAAPSPENTIAITCGPPIMIKFVLQDLAAMNFAPEQIVTTLEGKMQCCVGLCGRCNIGSKFICKDGPVFTLAELNEMNGDF